MEYKDKIIAAIAEKACEQVAAKALKSLRDEKRGLQSGDDSGLINIWDEICVLALPLCDRIQSNFDVRVHSLI